MVGLSRGQVSAPHLPPTGHDLPSIAVFARVPVAGYAKTRLIPMLGPQAAADFQAALVSDTLRKVVRLKGCALPYLFLTGSPIISRATSLFVAPCITEFRVIRQQGRDLGERLANAFHRLLRSHARSVIIGADLPLLPMSKMHQALRELKVCESVLGPCPDGGFYLIALRRPASYGMLQDIFRGIRWGTACSFGDTLRNLLRLGLSCSVLERCGDVDLPRDVQRVKKILSDNPAARRLAPATWKFLKRM